MLRAENCLVKLPMDWNDFGEGEKMVAKKKLVMGEKRNNEEKLRHKIQNRELTSKTNYHFVHFMLSHKIEIRANHLVFQSIKRNKNYYQISIRFRSLRITIFQLLRFKLFPLQSILAGIGQAATHTKSIRLQRASKLTWVFQCTVCDKLKHIALARCVWASCVRPHQKFFVLLSLYFVL